MVASRPQGPRGGGITTVHVWLIVFVGLWLISTVLAVLLYTQREELVMTAEVAEERAQQYMRRDEVSRFNVFLDQATSERKSLAALLDSERIELARLIGPFENNGATAVRNQINRMIAGLSEGAPKGAELPDLEGADLMTVVNRLRTAWLGQAKALAEANKTLEATLDDKGALAKLQEEDAAAFKTTLAELGDQIKKLDTEKGESIDAKNKQVKALQQQITKLQDVWEKQLVIKRRELRESEQEADKLRADLKRTQEQLTQFRPKVASLGLAAQADGKILRAQADENVVYIDLGSPDHLTLGLRFQVFSASVETDPSGEGKATIEVVGISPTTSECRVIEANPADPIMDGDYVINVVYDRTRKYRFVVEGQFDIDGDGRTDPQDVDRIKTWIKAWGGDVVQLPRTLGKTGARRTDVGLETVDFVVLGAPPPAPPKEKKGELKPEERARWAAMRRAFDRFSAIKQEAKDLSVAVLTQSQFLHFIGHGGNGKSRSSSGGKRTARGQ